MSNRKRWLACWFPEARLDPDFPLALWFAGLWFYLKSFLYFCYVYMAGTEPPPYSLTVQVETGYFAIMIIPLLLFGLAMWNRKNRFVLPAIVCLGVDTPILLLHVLRMGREGFLSSGLTKAMEVGSLTLNILAFVWLIAYYTVYKTKTSPKPAA